MHMRMISRVQVIVYSRSMHSLTRIVLDVGYSSDCGDLFKWVHLNDTGGDKRYL